MINIYENKSRIYYLNSQMQIKKKYIRIKRIEELFKLSSLQYIIGLSMIKYFKRYKTTIRLKNNFNYYL
jgi:hypothetical protein